MLRCPQLQPAGSALRLGWEDRQYAGATKSAHTMAVAGLSKRQRIDSDQAKRIIDARPRCPCCEQTMEKDAHPSMRVSAFKLHLNKVARIFEIQRNLTPSAAACRARRCACDVVHSSDLVDHEAELPHTGDAHDALRKPSVLA
ncbi:hypothetical protein T492DRAFT_899747 [Pavlovales sp. CCMP2436]|nr:hypothetical protein T492DRAFT_899747 [Pavlovales sp. CCMP2436]